MVSRTLRILFVLFQVWWLNAVIPGHVRGRFTLAAYTSDQRATATDSCCASKHDDKRSTPTPSDRSRCAVCYFAIGLNLPPAPIVAPPQTGLCCMLPVERPTAPVAEAPALPYHGRAPPAIACLALIA